MTKAIIKVLIFTAFSGMCLETASQTCDYHKRPANRRFNNTMYRLGKTRFFIQFSPSPYVPGNREWSQWAGNGYVKFFNAEARLATFLDKVSTNAIIARNLEHTIFKNNITRYTYWIGARNEIDRPGAYMWLVGLDKNPSIRYSNIFYKAPRVIGDVKTKRLLVNDSKENDIDYVHQIEKNTLTDYCLAFSLPFKNNPSLGHQTSWVQRVCNYPTYGLCELPSERFPECDENNLNLNPHVLTEHKEYYYTDGNWIFANRRFIVNWKPRNSWEAIQYCENYGLEVFAPTIDDLCLIPYLKMWGMVLNTYQFWTQYMYNTEERVFQTKDGTVIQRGAKKATHYLSSRQWYSHPDNVNVTYIWTYELKNETRCKDIHCKWSYYVLAPIYQNLYIGTICQHKKQDNTRACNFHVDWNNDFSQALAETSIVEFGYKGSGYWRSAYKQTFGSKECRHEERQMAGVNSDYWNVNVSDIEFIYDYLEEYWVVDEGLFQHVGKHEPLCTISIVTMEGNKFKRKTEKRNCDEWHFYLCESII